jgi:hypothetical protein
LRKSVANSLPLGSKSQIIQTVQHLSAESQWLRCTFGRRNFIVGVLSKTILRSLFISFSKNRLTGGKGRGLILLI